MASRDVIIDPTVTPSHWRNLTCLVARPCPLVTSDARHLRSRSPGSPSSDAEAPVEHGLPRLVRNAGHEFEHANRSSVRSVPYGASILRERSFGGQRVPRRDKARRLLGERTVVAEAFDRARRALGRGSSGRSVQPPSLTSGPLRALGLIGSDERAGVRTGRPAHAMAATPAPQPRSPARCVVQSTQRRAWGMASRRSTGMAAPHRSHAP